MLYDSVLCFVACCVRGFVVRCECVLVVAGLLGSLFLACVFVFGGVVVCFSGLCVCVCWCVCVFVVRRLELWCCVSRHRVAGILL